MSCHIVVTFSLNCRYIKIKHYENIFTGRGIYMYKKVGNSWQMFSMSGIKMNNKK